MIIKINWWYGLAHPQQIAFPFVQRQTLGVVSNSCHFGMDEDDLQHRVRESQECKPWKCTQCETTPSEFYFASMRDGNFDCPVCGEPLTVTDEVRALYASCLAAMTCLSGLEGLETRMGSLKESASTLYLWGSGFRGNKLSVVLQQSSEIEAAVHGLLRRLNIALQNGVCTLIFAESALAYYHSHQQNPVTMSRL